MFLNTRQQLLTASALSNTLMRYLISQGVSQFLNKIQFLLVNLRHRVSQSFRVFQMSNLPTSYVFNKPRYSLNIPHIHINTVGE